MSVKTQHFIVYRILLTIFTHERFQHTEAAILR